MDENTIQIPTLTENQKGWLKDLLAEEASDALGEAKTNHLWALGSDTQEEAVQFEEFADEKREYARILMDLVSELGLND